MNRKKQLKYLLGAVLLPLAFTACDDDGNPGGDNQPFRAESGIYVFNTGTEGYGIEGSLSYLDPATRSLRTSVFLGTNGRSLGSTVQDGVISGQPASNKGYFWAVSGGVRYGASGSDAVLALQRKLKAAGYDPNGLDRWYGRGCITADQMLLRDKGYYRGDVDGLHGHETNAAMCRALIDGLYSKSW